MEREIHHRAIDIFKSYGVEFGGSGSQGGQDASEPDWDANTGEPGHIKNRTHYIEEDYECVVNLEEGCSFEDGDTTLNHQYLIPDEANPGSHRHLVVGDEVEVVFFTDSETIGPISAKVMEYRNLSHDWSGICVTNVDPGKESFVSYSSNEQLADDTFIIELTHADKGDYDFGFYNFRGLSGATAFQIYYHVTEYHKLETGYLPSPEEYWESTNANSDAWSRSKAYGEGSYCICDGSLYRALGTSQDSYPPDNIGTDWEAVTIVEALNALNDLLTNDES